MAVHRQVNWSSGELARSLWGRTDLGLYASGARTLKNFFVTPQGVLMNRSGGQHIANLPAGACRLVPFVFSETDNAILVFSNQRMDVLTPDSLDARHRWSLSTVLNGVAQIPFQGAHLARLRFVQVGNVMTIVSPDYDPYELRRVSASAWELRGVSFAVEAWPAWTSNPRVQVLGDAPNQPTLYAPAGDIAQGLEAREWTWQVTRLVRDTETGITYETMPFTVVEQFARHAVGPDTYAPIPSHVAVYPTWTQRLELGAKEGDATGVGVLTYPPVIVASRIYRGRGGEYGLVGETTGSFFIDDGTKPNLSSPPPQGHNPFRVMAGVTLLRTERPTVAAFYENRMLLGGTAERPARVFVSKHDDYKNHDIVRLPDAADATQFGLVSAKNEVLRNLVPRDQGLVALTSSAEWLIKGSGLGEVIVPGGVAARQFSEHGCAASPAALPVGDSILFVQAKGAKPIAMLVTSQGVRAVDLTILAAHLFEGATVVDWAYAEDPYSIVWVALSTGQLLSLTYVPSVEMIAWCRHALADSGKVESVATKPEGNEDAIYLVVNRSGTRTLERLAYRLLGGRTITPATGDEYTVQDVRNAVFLDRAVTYNGKYRPAENEANKTFTITDAFAGAGAIGTQVRITLDAIEPIVFGVQTSKEGRTIQIDAPDGGEPYRLRVGVLDAALDNYPCTVMNRALPASLFGVKVLPEQWGYAVQSVSGLAHLAGKTVTALVDGNVFKDLTVVGDTVSLGPTSWGVLIHVGRTYYSDFESLAAADGKGLQKNVRDVLLEMEHTRGGLIGTTLDNLVEIPNREVEDDYSTMIPKRFEEKVTVADKWSPYGYVAYRQDQPLPVTLLGVTRDVVHGG